MLKINKSIFILALSCMLLLPLSVFAKDKSNDFISPVKDGVVTIDFDEERGLKCIHMRSDDQMATSIDVLASADGKITQIFERDNDTYSVLIEHEDGYSTLYGGLKTVNFDINDKVKQEDIIGNTKTISMSFVIIHDDVRLENTRDLIGLN